MIIIGVELEQAITAIVCCCQFSIDWSVFDQINLDSVENQVDPKHYVLHSSKQMQLSASVDAYESESVTLHLDRGSCKQFEAITTAASDYGFGVHAYFLDRPQKAPPLLIDSLTTFHATSEPNRPLLRCQLIATHRMTAVTRCFLDRTGIRPTPYVVYATNIRTMQTVQLTGVDAAPYTIKGYR